MTFKTPGVKTKGKESPIEEMKRNGLSSGIWERHHGLSSGIWDRHQTLAFDEEKYVSARACSISDENESAYINAVNELGYCDHYSKTETGVFIRTPTPYSKTGVLTYANPHALSRKVYVIICTVVGGTNASSDGYR